MDDLVCYFMKPASWMVLRDRKVETVFFWSPDHIAEGFFTATEAASGAHSAAKTVVVKSEDSVPLIPTLVFRQVREFVSVISHYRNPLPSISVMYSSSILEIILQELSTLNFLMYALFSPTEAYALSTVVESRQEWKTYQHRCTSTYKLIKV